MTEQNWQQKYADEAIARSLNDAAMQEKAYFPNVVTQLLRDNASVSEPDANGRAAVTVDVNGEKLSPVAAVRRMKESKEHGNLFRDVHERQMTESAAPPLKGYPMSGGRLDTSSLTPTQYREIREKAPELLGLRRKKGQ